MNRKTTIIIIAVLSVLFISMVVAIIILNKRIKTKEKELIEMDYTQAKTSLKVKEYKLKYNQQIEIANNYRLKYENYEKKLETIYDSAMLVDNKAVKEFFTNGQFNFKH
jgi:predicted Holliday junction resolvase-like endonuclease